MSLPTIAAIRAATARQYGVPANSMREPSASKGAGRWEFVRPRQAAMELCALLTSHSYVRIGHFFGGRDHSTVIAARRSVARRRRTDAELHERMRRVTLDLIRRG
jgi:chromosomal replication initiator protein